MHDFAFLGSVGHGTRRLRYVVVAEMTSIVAVMMNSGTLCSDNQTSCGTLVTRAAIAAPAPSETSNAGRAQHTRVPNEPSNVTLSMTMVRRWVIYLARLILATE